MNRGNVLRLRTLIVIVFLCGLVVVASAAPSSNVKAMPASRSSVAGSNTWAALPPLNTHPFQPAAATGPDGLVYIIGGLDSSPLSTVQAYSTSTNSWASVANMPTARYALAAVTGPDGRIYAIGGFNQGLAPYTFDTVEAYDPTTKTWACSTDEPPSAACSSNNLTPMSTARSNLAAAVGRDGLIYVIGGFNGSSLGVVEAYDPSTNTWTCSAGDSDPSHRCQSSTLTSMPTARADFAAATGADGRIYAMGGPYENPTPTQILNTVEAYTPGSNIWYCSSGDLSSGCSPTNTPPTPMPTARYVLAAASGSDGLIYAIGGSTGSESDFVEAYNPSTQKWTCSTDDLASACSSSTLMPMPTARFGLAAVTGSDSRIYAIGGANSSGNLATVEAYTPAAGPAVCSVAGDTWCADAYLPLNEQSLAAAVGSDGRIYALGGDRDWHFSQDTVLAYSTSSNFWGQAPSLPTRREGLAAAAGADGRIYTLGGYDYSRINNGTSGYLPTIEVFDATTQTWTCSTDDLSPACSSNTLAPMPTARSSFAAVTGADGRIYAIGGGNAFATLNLVEAYDPTTKTWACSVGDPDPASRCHSTGIAPMPTSRSDLALTVGVDGKIYAIGGEYAGNPVPFGTVEIFDPQSNTWTCSISDSNCSVSQQTVAPMPTARWDLVAATAADGRIYAFGGSAGLGNLVSTVEAYNPGTNSWSPAASMLSARSQMAAATGLDGRIYLLGGTNILGAVAIVESYLPLLATPTPTATASPTNTVITGPTVTPSTTPTPNGPRASRVYLPVVDVPLPVLTPTRTGTPTSTPISNPIQNGSFENGLQGWTPGSTNFVSIPVISTTTANSGTHSLLLGDPSYPCFGAPSYGESYVSQQITLPAGSQPTLTYYIDMRSQDYLHDAFVVYANNLGNYADRLGVPFQPTNPSGGQNPCVETAYHWQKQSVAIPAQYLGKPLTLYFVNETTDQNWNTWTYLDDVSITFP